MTERISHTLAPVFDSQSRILILGTMPSPRSRETGFYYGNPQNRFWRVLSGVFSEELPEDNREKTEFLLRRRIALWDVLASCSIEGADDSSIKDPVPNDLGELLRNADIRAVFTTGKKAWHLYRKFIFPVTQIPAIYLPSTSPANCARYAYEDLVREYEQIKSFV